MIKRKPPKSPRLTPSPDGTFSTTITDAHDGVWLLGPNRETIRWVDTGSGSEYCWSEGVLYVHGVDDQWYRLREDHHWEHFGATPPIPKPHPDMSPDGTCAFEVVDVDGHRWTIGANQATLCDGAWIGGGSGSYYLYSGRVVFVFGIDLNWHYWSGEAWRYYGPEPPVPVTPPTPGATCPPRLYRNADSWPQALCHLNTATPVVIKGVSAFPLAEMIAHGREPEAIGFLDWCQMQRLNMVRVFLSCSNMFPLTPDEGRAALPRLLELAGNRGLYVEAVAIADSFAYAACDWAAHVRAVGEICAAYPNSLVEGANEPMQQWQPFNPDELYRFCSQIPSGVPWTLGAADGPNDESRAYCSKSSSWQNVHSDRTKAPWGNVRHTREQQVLSDEINQYVGNDEPGDDFTPAQQFAIGGLCRVCMLWDTFHADQVKYGQIPTGAELDAFRARQAAWDFVPDGAWGTFANYGWVPPNPESPVQAYTAHSDDSRAYAVLVGDREAYVLLSDGCSPVWKSGWTCDRKDERTSRVDGVIETGLYHVYR